VPLGEEIPLELVGTVEVYPLNNGYPLHNHYLPLFTSLAWKRLQTDADLLLTITSTADKLLRGTNIDDLEQPGTPTKIRGFSNLFAILGCDIFQE